MKVNIDVWGNYTHGRLEGKTNPKAVVNVTLFGRDMDEVKGKIRREFPDCLHKITGVSMI